MKKNISLKDIAQKVGVSTALVSYVLNDKKIGRIGKEITQKIKDAALELNYTGNSIAKGLKTRKTFTIGLIVADISNPFWSGLARIIEDEAEKIRYTVLFGSSDESPEKCEKLIKVFLSHQVDGLIIAPTENSANQMNLLINNETPFVLIDRYTPDFKTNYVAINNFNASFRLVQHVIDEGFKRIGIITFKSSLFHLQERVRGYTSAIKENGLFLNPDWQKVVGIHDTKVEVANAINDLLSLPEPVEAIFFTSNELSRFGLKYIITLPIKVPDDLAIISFDESDAADLFYSPITYIKQPLQEMGHQALVSLINNIESNKVTATTLEGEFVLQKSSLKKSVCK